MVGARIRQAGRRGARLIVIDPRRTELAAEAEAIHLAPRPGTNIPLLNALAHVIVTEELCDTPFLAERVAGLAEFQAFIADWPPERASAICGVPAEDIRRAARRYATGRPSMIVHGLGITEHQQGTDGVSGLVNLALLTGNLGRPGSGVNPLRGQNNVQGSAQMGCDPAALTGGVPIEAGRTAFEAAWGALGASHGGHEAARHDRCGVRRAVEGARRLRLRHSAHESERESHATRPRAPRTACRRRSVLDGDRGPGSRLPAGAVVLRERRDIHERRTPGAARSPRHRARRRVEIRCGHHLRPRRRTGSWPSLRVRRS